MYIERINKDQEFWDTCVQKAEHFIRTSILPELYERIQDKILRLVGDKEDHDSHTYTQEETEESETCTFIQQLEEDIETHLETLRIYKSVCKLDRIFNNMVSSDSLSNADTLARIKEYDKEYEELLSALSEIPEHTELMDAMQSLEKLCSSIRKEALRHISSPSLPCVSDSTASTEHNSDTIRFARLELPTFSGNPSHWPRFFEDFTNGISKRHLTDSDKLQYLQRAMESEEGRAIITTGRDGGNNYDDIIHRLIERFDRPRDACRSAIADWMAHRHELSHDGIGQSLTAFETTHSILKRYTDGSLKTVLALVCVWALPQATPRVVVLQLRPVRAATLGSQSDRHINQEHCLQE